MKKEIFELKIPVGSGFSQLVVREGESLAVIGENGSGKSALLKLLARRGRGVSYRGIKSRLTKDENDLFNLEIGYFDGTLYGNPKEKVGEVIEEAAVFFDMLSKEVALAFGISEADFDKPLKQLTYDKTIRLALMRVLCEGHKIILIDDVFGLDFLLKKSLVPFLAMLKEKFALTYVIATTDLAMALTLTAWTLIIEDKQIVEYGRTQKLLRTPKHPYSVWLVDSVTLKKDNAVRFIRTAKDEKPKKKACRFSVICPLAEDVCRMESPDFVPYGATELTACHKVKQI